MPNGTGFIFPGEVFTGDLLVASDDITTDPYEIIKEAEDLFPVPTPETSVDVGTLDSFTGEFTGLVSTKEVIPPGVPGPHKPQIVEIPPRVDVDAVNVVLTFTIRNRQSGFSVTANGITVTAADNETTIAVPVGKAYIVDWVLTAGPNTIEDRLILSRPLIIGAGAFTLPAFPTAVVYEPPPDRQNKNSASYTTSTSVGTKVSTSFSDEQSTTRPVDSDYFHLIGLKEQIELFATAIGQGAAFLDGGGTTKSVLIGALNTVARGIGSASATQTKGLKVTEDQMVATESTFEDGISTGTNDGGPGVGDLIVFLRDVELAWVTNGGLVSLAVLGYERVSVRTVQSLSDELQSGGDLAPDVIEALLGLDPFVSGGPRASLDPDRFVFVEAYELNGLTLSKTFSHKVTQADRMATTNFQVNVQDLKKGFLSFVGLGVPETATIKVTSSHSSSVENTQTETARISVNLHAEASEVYGIEVYFDRIFGTFAFRELPLGDSATLVGQINDTAGNAMPGQLVTALVGGRRISTHSDDQGRYTFRSTELARGEVKVQVGDVTAPVRPDGRVGGFTKDIHLERVRRVMRT